jgi:hypothetical protein
MTTFFLLLFMFTPVAPKHPSRQTSDLYVCLNFMKFFFFFFFQLEFLVQQAYSNVQNF